MTLAFTVAAAAGLLATPASGQSGPPVRRLPEPAAAASAASPGEPSRETAPSASETSPGPAPAPPPLPGTLPLEAPKSGTQSSPAPPRPPSAEPMAPSPARPSAPPVVPAPLTCEASACQPRFRLILSGHDDSYFATTILGDRLSVKFQYSFKFDLWPNATRHSLYFGFTQKSLWRLWDVKNSAAFVDSNYAPEIFYGYYSRDDDPVSRPGRITWTWIYDGRVGLMHESNGDDGTRSRAWNRVYARVRSGAYFGTDHYVTLSPRIWAPPFALDEFNTDIVKFLGYGTLTAEYGYDPLERPWWGGGHAGVTIGKGELLGLSHVTVEGFVQWRPAYEDRAFAWWKFTPFFYLQARHGYADTLLSYNKEESSVRLGIALEDHVEWVTSRRRSSETP